MVPEVTAMVGCAQNRYHEFDVWGHTLAVVDAAPEALKLAAFFHDIAKPTTKGTHPCTGDATFYSHEVVGAEITYSRLAVLLPELAGITAHLVRHHYVRYDSTWDNTTVRRWVRKVCPENVSAILALARADIAGKGEAKEPLDAQLIDDLESRISALPPPLPPRKVLAVSGTDVMRVTGLSPGPLVGQTLRELELRVGSGELPNTTKALLAWLDRAKS